MTEPNATKQQGATIEVLPFQDQLVRFLVILVLSWVLLYSCMSANAEWTVETLIPWTFCPLHYLVVFGIIGGGWPLTAPFGSYGQAFWGNHGRLLLGLAMTGLITGAGVALSAFLVNVYPGYPLFPGGAWFGLCLFYVSLWWVLVVQTSPKPLVPLHPTLPLVNIVVNSTIIIVLTLGVFQFMNFDGPDNADPSNPQGPFGASHFFEILVSIIVWVQCFANILVFQGTPLQTMLPHPLPHIALTLLSIGLGVAVYEAVGAAGLDQSFYVNAIGGSQISGSLYHAVGFDFWPYHQIRQPLRGLYSFVLTQILFPFFWIWLCRIMLQPIYDIMVQANPEVYGSLFTVYTLIPWFSLHTMAALLIIHQSFFMRWPFAPPGPPLGPMDVGIVMNDSEDGNEEETRDSLLGAGEDSSVELPEQRA